MDKNCCFIPVRMRKRPWYAWFAWALFAVWILLWVEFSIGSWRELEYPAFWLSIKVLAVSLILGVLLWCWKAFAAASKVNS